MSEKLYRVFLALLAWALIVAGIVADAQAKGFEVKAGQTYQDVGPAISGTLTLYTENSKSYADFVGKCQKHAISLRRFEPGYDYNDVKDESALVDYSQKKPVEYMTKIDNADVLAKLSVCYPDLASAKSVLLVFKGVTSFTIDNKPQSRSAVYADVIMLRRVLQEKKAVTEGQSPR